MMKIEAIVGPSRLEAVQKALTHSWIAGLTVTEVKGQRGPAASERSRGVERPAALVPLLRIEVVVPAPLVPRLLHDLTRALRDARSGEDLLLVLPVVEAFRVRTGERGEAAL